MGRYQFTDALTDEEVFDLVEQNRLQPSSARVEDESVQLKPPPSLSSSSDSERGRLATHHPGYHYGYILAVNLWRANANADKVTELVKVTWKFRAANMAATFTIFGRTSSLGQHLAITHGDKEAK